jgi:DNA modification methylase
VVDRARYSKRVCDPFCGQGTVLHVAESLGADSVGVDIDPKVCEITRKKEAPGDPALPRSPKQANSSAVNP